MNLFFEQLLVEGRCVVLPTAIHKGVLITTHKLSYPLISLLHQGLPGGAGWRASIMLNDDVNDIET